MATVLILLVGSSLVTLLAMKLANRRWPHWSNRKKILIAGLLPLGLVVVVLVGAHLQLVAEYQQGLMGGFMSPLLILVMGYPIVLINLAANFAVAYWFRAKP